MIRGLGHAGRTKKPTLWLCFAKQIFLNIGHTLREEAGKAFGELQSAEYTARNLLK